MFYTVVFTPEAEGQLTNLFSYIAGASSPEVAARYTDGIVTCCESLHAFPLRGTARDDIRPGLRITGYQKRVVIAFEVGTDRVNIISVVARIGRRSATLGEMVERLPLHAEQAQRCAPSPHPEDEVPREELGGV